MNVRPDNTAAALNPAQASVIRAGELGRVSIAPASDATGQLTSSGSPSSRFERKCCLDIRAATTNGSASDVSECGLMLREVT
jgi:hypothetical protein